MYNNKTIIVKLKYSEGSLISPWHEKKFLLMHCYPHHDCLSKKTFLEKLAVSSIIAPVKYRVITV